MTKPDLFIVVGLARAGVPQLMSALEANRTALEESGVRLPARSEDEVFRAAVEVRREHRAWGLRRKDVEGTWARLARRSSRRLAEQERVVLGHELLAGATPDQVALLVDALRATSVHVVAVVTAPDPLAALVPAELDLADVLSRWVAAVKTPDRLHLLVADPVDASATWRALGAVVGFDTTALTAPNPLPGGLVGNHVAGPAVTTLDAATMRLLADATYAVLDRNELADLAERWAKAAAEQGYDVRGDLAALQRPAQSHPTAPDRDSAQVRVEVLRQALAETVAEVGRLRERLGTS